MKYYLKTILSNVILNVAIIIVIAAGIFIRFSFAKDTIGYFLDDYRFMYQLMTHSYIDILTKPLNDAQICPPLFAIMLKFIYSHFGENHFILGSISLLSSCLALIFMPIVTFKICHNKFAAFISTVLIAFNFRILLYTIRLKQYSTDILLSIILIYAGYLFFSKPITKKKMFLFSIFCIICGLISYTSIIIICCFCFYYLFLFKKDEIKTKLTNFLIFTSSWLIAFLPYLTFVGIANINNEEHRVYWHYYISNFDDIINSVYYLLAPPQIEYQVYPPFLWGFIFFQILTGIFVIIWKKEKYLFSSLILPIIIAEILGICLIYPFGFERASLWSCPLFIILFTLPSIYIKLEKSFSGIISVSMILYYLLFSCIFINSIKDIKIPGDWIFGAQNTFNIFIEELQKSDITDDDVIFAFQTDGNPMIESMFVFFADKKDFSKNKKVFTNSLYYYDELLMENDNIYYIFLSKDIFIFHENRVMFQNELYEYIKENLDIIYEYKTWYGDIFIKAK